jgi:hypothetical protein
LNATHRSTLLPLRLLQPASFSRSSHASGNDCTNSSRLIVCAAAMIAAPVPPG